MMNAGDLQSRHILGIDTATPAGGVALATELGKLVAHTWRADSTPIARFLLPDIDRLLSDNRIAREAIAGIAITHGPGAFTGLRLGLALAKTLAHGWGVPVFGYSTLAIMAQRWPVEGDVVAVLLDARRGEVYSGLYRVRENDAPLALRTECAETIESFLDALNSLESPVHLTGSGAAKYRDALAARLGARVHWIAPPWDGPAADVVALAGARDLREGRVGLDPLAVEPIYLRTSDAERRHPSNATASVALPIVS